MRKLNDGTEVPDIIRYLVFEYKNKFLKEWLNDYGNIGIEELTKEQFVSYSDKAYNWFKNEIK